MKQTLVLMIRLERRNYNTDTPTICVRLLFVNRYAYKLNTVKSGRFVLLHRYCFYRSILFYGGLIFFYQMYDQAMFPVRMKAFLLKGIVILPRGHGLL